MRFATFAFLAAMCVLLMPCAVLGNQAPKSFLQGVSAYNQGDYAGAEKKFIEITDQGIKNYKLFYNLGNTYFKKGDIGRAILWYERASQLAPGDPDLKFNLSFARSRIKDKAEAEEGRVRRILFFWNYVLNPSAVQMIALVLNGIFWLMLAVNAVLKKRTSRLFCWVASVLIVLFSATVFYNFYEEKFVKKAIIISDEVPVRSGWAADATELFVLHAGTRVKVERTQNGYYRISFSKDKIGWLKKTDAEVI